MNDNCPFCGQPRKLLGCYTACSAPDVHPIFLNPLSDPPDAN